MNFFIIIIGKSIGDGVAFFSANMRGQQIFGLLASLLFRWEDRYGCPRRQEWHGMREDLLGGACIELGFFFQKMLLCVYSRPFVCPPHGFVQKEGEKIES